MTRSCTTCHVEFATRNARHTTCPRCQVIRDLSFTISSRRCRSCGIEFWPARRSWRRCPGCVTPAKPDTPLLDGCGHPYPPAPGLEKTCVACVQSSRSMAERYLASLLKKRDTE